MANVHSLSEWTYSVRDFRETDTPGLYEGIDSIDAQTKIFCKVVANPDALTVDYHCAWDQGRRPVDDLSQSHRSGGAGAQTSRLGRLLGQLPPSQL